MPYFGLKAVSVSVGIGATSQVSRCTMPVTSSTASTKAI